MSEWHSHDGVHLHCNEMISVIHITYVHVLADW